MCSIRPQSHLHHLQGFGNLQGLCHLQRILLLGFCVGRIFSDYGSSLFLANAYDDSDILLGLEPFWADLLLGLEPFWANWGTLSCKCNSLSGWGSCHLLLALVKFCALIIWIKLWHYYYTHMFIYFAKHVLLRFFCFNLLVCHNKASVEDLDKIVDLTTIQMRSTVDKNNVRMWLDLIVLGYCRVFVGVFSSVVNLWSASWCGCLLSLFFLSFFLHFSFFLSFFLVPFFTAQDAGTGKTASLGVRADFLLSTSARRCGHLLPRSWVSWLCLAIFWSSHVLCNVLLTQKVSK